MKRISACEICFHHLKGHCYLFNAPAVEANQDCAINEDLGGDIPEELLV